MTPITPNDPRRGQQAEGGQTPVRQTIVPQRPAEPDSPVTIAARQEQLRREADQREREAAAAASGGGTITNTATTTATSPKWWESYLTLQEQVKLKEIPEASYFFNRENKVPEEIDFLEPVRHVIEAQHTKIQPYLTTFTMKMVACSNAVNTRVGRLEKFIQQESKNDPERPTFTPRSMRLKVEVTYSKECQGDDTIKTLEQEMADLVRNFESEAGKVCKKVAQRELEVHTDKRVETLVKEILKLIKFEIKYHSTLLKISYDKDTEHDTIAQTGFKILYGYLQIHPDQGLDEPYFTEYLQTTRAKVIQCLLKTASSDVVTQDTIKTHTFEGKQAELAIEVLKSIAPAIPVVTRDFQKFLDHRLREREAQETAAAYTASLDKKEAAAQAAVDLESEPTPTANTMGQYISADVQQKSVTFASGAVEKAARLLSKHNKAEAAKVRKNSLGRRQNHQSAKPSEKSTNGGRKNHRNGGQGAKRNQRKPSDHPPSKRQKKQPKQKGASPHSGGKGNVRNDKNGRDQRRRQQK